MLAAGCSDRYEGTLPARDRIHFPIGLELHPEGRFLYVVNTNFDARYRDELGGTVSVIDTEDMTLLSEATPLIPSYGGFIRLNGNGTRAYVTTRHEGELVALHVAPQGQALFCPDADGNPSVDPERCLIRRIPNEEGAPTLGSDPFGLAVATVVRPHPETGEEHTIDLVNVSHLRGSQVTTVALPDGERAGASMFSAALLAGGNQIVRRPGTLDFYVAGRSTNQVVIFQPFLNANNQVEALVRRGQIELSRVIEAVDARGLAFGADGSRLYVATRNPTALHVVGVEGLRHEVLRTIPLSAQPSDVVVHTGADGLERLYVLSYAEGTIDVLDPQAGVTLETIEVGQSPYQMIVDRAADRCRAPGERCQAYVSLFDDTGDPAVECEDREGGCGAIVVVDLDPDSPTFHQVVNTLR